MATEENERFSAERITTAAQFGALLRELRGRLTQQSISRRSLVDGSSLTRQLISAIENGRLPSAQQLRCYLHACEREELFAELDPVRRSLPASTRPPGAPADSGPAPRPGRSSILVAVAAIVLLVAAFTVSADGFRPSPASSAARIPECGQNFICFWSEPDFGGRKVELPPDWAGDGQQCTPLPFLARSVMNNSAERHWGHTSPSCTGAEKTIIQHLGGTIRSAAINAYIHT